MVERRFELGHLEPLADDRLSQNRSDRDRGEDSGNEFTFPSAQLVLEAETKMEDAGSDSLREILAVHARFASSELQPNPLNSALEDLAVDFEANFPGADALSHLRIVIPSDLWSDGNGGGFKIEELSAQSSGILALVLQVGQVVADLTNQVATVAASLRPDANTKTWDLRLEIDGIVTPSDVHVPLFARAAGSRVATVVIDKGLEQLFAQLREAAAIF